MILRIKRIQVIKNDLLLEYALMKFSNTIVLYDATSFLSYQEEQDLKLRFQN